MGIVIPKCSFHIIVSRDKILPDLRTWNWTNECIAR
jgi:hypothetical protein